MLKEFFQKGGGTSEQLYEIAATKLPPKRVKKLLDKVAELLILRPDMPRSLAACVSALMTNLGGHDVEVAGEGEVRAAVAAATRAGRRRLLRAVRTARRSWRTGPR